MNVIILETEDDIISVRDRIDWSDEKQLLLVLPASGGALRTGLDLVRLRRYADQMRVEVGLVTSDKPLARQARALGLPAFASVSEGKFSRRGWWRGRRRREQVGLAPMEGLWHQQATTELGAEGETPIRTRHWLFRYLAILLFFAAIAFLVIGFSYTLPRATIILKPDVIPVRGSQVIVADPKLSQIDYQQGAVSGQLLQVVQSWQSEIATTGSIPLPVAPARGQVLFINLADEAVNVPQGTILSTEDGRIRFETVAPLSVAGVLSSTAEVDVVALDLGPQGNVDAGAVSRIDGELANQLQVNNPTPMIGGEVRQVPAVVEADLIRLRSQVLQFLQAVALAEMETSLTEREFLVRESLEVIGINYEVFSHNVGEQTDKLRLKMEATLQATAIDRTQLSGLVYESLVNEVSDGHVLVPESITYAQDQILSVDEGGRVTFSIMSEGVAAVELELADRLETISGQRPEFALAYLYGQLPLREIPAVDIWPTWFDRIPYRPGRIDTEILVLD